MMAIGAAIAAVLVAVAMARSGLQAPTVRSVDEKVLREYTGAYSWGSGPFVYLQLWNEFSGFDKPAQLVAFDEDGLVRVLYPTAARPVLRRARSRGSRIGRGAKGFSATAQGRITATRSGGVPGPNQCARPGASRVRSTKPSGSRTATSGWPEP